MSGKPYPSDLTNAQRKPIAPLIPSVESGGRPRKYDMRGGVNGILYVNREGCIRRVLPHDLPHWKACRGGGRVERHSSGWPAAPGRPAGGSSATSGRSPPEPFGTVSQ